MEHLLENVKKLPGANPVLEPSAREMPFAERRRQAIV
jgi:hypothetical protein